MNEDLRKDISEDIKAVGLKECPVLSVQQIDRHHKQGLLIISYSQLVWKRENHPENLKLVNQFCGPFFRGLVYCNIFY